ncbi:hypothetical protein ABG752_10405 [Streptococcus iniae]
MFVDKTYQKTSDFMLYAVILLVLTTVVTYAINPNTSRLVTAIATKIPTKLSQANGMEKVMIYIQHNAFTVPLKMLLLALLPIPFLFLIHLLLSVTILGIAFAIVLRYDAGQGMALILSSLPHSFLSFLEYVYLLAYFIDLIMLCITLYMLTCHFTRKKNVIA